VTKSPGFRETAQPGLRLLGAKRAAKSNNELDIDEDYFEEVIKNAKALSGAIQRETEKKYGISLGEHKKMQQTRRWRAACERWRLNRLSLVSE